MINILMVEDDSTIAFGVKYALEQEGFSLEICKDLESSRKSIHEKNYDIILLDVTLPDGNGYDFCKEIRKTNNTPIIFLTACDDEVNIVMGLDLGGDDYITKPFRVRELISRIKAVLRRNKKEEAPQKVLKYGDLSIFNFCWIQTLINFNSKWKYSFKQKSNFRKTLGCNLWFYKW